MRQWLEASDRPDPLDAAFAVGVLERRAARLKSAAASGWTATTIGVALLAAGLAMSDWIIYTVGGGLAAAVLVMSMVADNRARDLDTLIDEISDKATRTAPESPVPVLTVGRWALIRHRK